MTSIRRRLEKYGAPNGPELMNRQATAELARGWDKPGSSSGSSGGDGGSGDGGSDVLESHIATSAAIKSFTLHTGKYVQYMELLSPIVIDVLEGLGDLVDNYRFWVFMKFAPSQARETVQPPR